MTRAPARPGWFRRLFVCAGGWCPCRPYADEGGAGGQCIECGRIFGYCTNEELRRFAEYGITRRREPKRGR